MKTKKLWLNLIIESSKQQDLHGGWSKTCDDRTSTIPYEGTSSARRHATNPLWQEPCWQTPTRSAQEERIRHGWSTARFPTSLATRSQKSSRSTRMLTRSTAITAVNRTGLRLWVYDSSEKYSSIGNFSTLVHSTIHMYIAKTNYHLHPESKYWILRRFYSRFTG